MKTKATAANGTKTSTTAKATPKKKLSVMERAMQSKVSDAEAKEILMFADKLNSYKI